MKTLPEIRLLLYADLTEDWCEITAGELESEGDYEPGSEEHTYYLTTTVYEDFLSTGYYNEEEAQEFIKRKIEDALKFRKCLIEPTKTIKPIDLKEFEDRERRAENLAFKAYRQTVEKVVNYKAGESRPIVTNYQVKEWLIAIHKLYDELDFQKIVDEYKLFLGVKLRSSDKFKLTFALQELIE